MRINFQAQQIAFSLGKLDVSQVSLKVNTEISEYLAVMTLFTRHTKEASSEDQVAQLMLYFQTQC